MIYMCGRFAQTAGLTSLMQRYELKDVSFDYHPSYNIAPTQNIAVVVRSRVGNNLVHLKWGFTLNYADGPVINARDDKILQVKAFKNALLNNRCLIPADGFYEWEKVGNKKNPHYFKLKSNETFSFSGLYQEIKTTNGSIERRCTIITTGSNLLVANTHDRMPVILLREDESLWLDATTELEKLVDLLHPYPAELMEVYTVSDRVNSFKNNDPDLIKPKTSLKGFV